MPYPDRLARTRARLTDADAFIITSRFNCRYLTGFTGSAGVLIMARAPGGRDDRLLVDGRYEVAVRAAQAAGLITPVPVTRIRNYPVGVIEAAKAAGWRRVAFEADHTTVAERDRWSEGLPGVELVPVYGWVETLRQIKDNGELAILRRAAGMLSDVASNLARVVAIGRSEREVAAGIDAALSRIGFEKPAFETIVAAGPNSAYPHARPTDRRIQSGELVLLDFGGVLEGYCVDLTRMAHAGAVGSAAESLYTAVRKAQDAAIAAVRPGALTTEVDDAARQVLVQQQLGDAFVHGTGHGLGLDVHEAPRLGPGDPAEAVRLEPGMVVTIEPGAYVEGLGGVRLEDDVLVTAEGCEVLTTAPRDLLIV
jgi:Xaa-Pro aminopeptidase